MYIPKEGEVEYVSAEPYMGKGAFETAEMLHEKFGSKGQPVYLRAGRGVWRADLRHRLHRPGGPTDAYFGSWWRRCRYGFQEGQSHRYRPS